MKGQFVQTSTAEVLFQLGNPRHVGTKALCRVSVQTTVFLIELFQTLRAASKCQRLGSNTLS